ncbi:MAG: hypothetical protein H5T64_00730 [Chloroflexi bacterium]|nr:hypothetical protein [Chloroflexota bacterium]
MKRRSGCVLVMTLLIGVGIGLIVAQTHLLPPLLPQITSKSSAPVYALDTSRTLESRYVITAPVLDGNLADWPTVPSITMDAASCDYVAGTIGGVNDCSASVRSVWDDTNVYFGIDVTDDVLKSDDPSYIWRDDSVEIGLDGARDRVFWNPDDHQYAVASDGRTFYLGAPTTELSAAVQVRSGGYIVEMAVPLNRLVLSGQVISGTVCGFTVGLRDDDDNGTWDGYLVWAGTTTFGIAENFGELRFVGQPPPVCDVRLDQLEARLADLERKIQQLLDILSEFGSIIPPR